MNEAQRAAILKEAQRRGLSTLPISKNKLNSIDRDAIFREAKRRGININERIPPSSNSFSSSPSTGEALRNRESLENERRKNNPPPLQQAPENKEGKGFFESLGRGAKLGLTEDLPGQAQTLYNLATGKAKESSPHPVTPSKPLDFDRESIGEFIGRAGTSSIPSLVGTFGGTALGALGGSYLPGPGTAVGGLAGMATGAASTAGLQTLAEFYNDARLRGATHEKALDEAKKAGFTSAAINGLTGSLAGVGLKVGQPLLKTMTPYLAKQLGIQSTGATADVVQQNYRRKESGINPQQSLTEGVPEAIAGQALFQALPVAAVTPKLMKSRSKISSPQETTQETHPAPLEAPIKEEALQHVAEDHLQKEDVLPKDKVMAHDIDDPKKRSGPLNEEDISSLNKEDSRNNDIEFISKKIFGEQEEKKPKNLTQKAKEEFSLFSSNPKEYIKEFSNKLEGNIFDRNIHIKKYENKESGEKTSRAAAFSKHTSGMLEGALFHGTPYWDSKEKVIRLKEGSEGLRQILNPVLKSTKDLKNFEAYAYAKRVKDNDLIQKGKEHNINVDQQNALIDLEKSNPEYKEVFDQLQEYQNSILDLAAETGIISNDARNQWKEMAYVPFYRLIDEGKSLGPYSKRSLANQKNNIKELTGGKEQYAVFNEEGEQIGRYPTKEEANSNLPPHGEIHEVGPPTADIVQNIVQNVESLLGASVRNATANEAINLGIKGEVVSSIPKEEAFQKGRQKPDVVQTMVDGKKAYFKIDDPGLFSALSDTIAPYKSKDIVTSGLGWVKNKVSSLIMLNPAVQASVAVKDIIQSRMLGKDPVPIMGNTMKNIGSAFRHMLAESYGEGAVGGLAKSDVRAIEMMSMGGSSLFYENASPKIKEKFFKIAEENEKKAQNAVKKYNAQFLSVANPKDWYSTLEKLSRAAEMSTRLSIYDAAKKRGASSAEAVHSSLDYMNYSQRGSHPAINFLGQTVPFLNAHLTSLHKLGREINRGGKPFINRTGKAIGVVAGLSMLNALNNLREDELEEDKANGYESLPQYIRDTNMVIDNYKYFGKEASNSLNLPRFILVKAPWEIGTLAMIAPAKVVESMAGKSGFKENIDFLKRTILNTMSFNPLGNPLINETIQQWSNKDSYTGRPIVHPGRQKLSPELQYSNYTGEIPKAIGKATGISPDRLEHAAKGFLGVMYALPAMTTEVFLRQNKPPLKPSQLPIINQFVKDAPTERSHYEKEFYDIYQKMNEVYSTSKKLKELGEVDALQDYMKDNKQYVVQRKVLQRMKKDLKEMNDQSIQIQESNQPPLEKRKQIEHLNKNRNLILYRFHNMAQKMFK